MRAFSSGEDFKKIPPPAKAKKNKERTTIMLIVFMIGT
jgi:hypothetical protein